MRVATSIVASGGTANGGSHYRTVIYDLERFDAVVPAPDGLSHARYLANTIGGQRGKADFPHEIFKSPAAG